MSVAILDTGAKAGGLPVLEAVLRNDAGMQVRLLNWGATIASIRAPDRHGRPDEVTLGFDRAADYVTRNGPYFGAICGRVANRIAGGTFTLDGVGYRLAVNNGPNHLHGGLRGFDKQVWALAGTPAPAGDSVAFRLVSPDGDEGYPGRVGVEVRYTLGADCALTLDYTATADRATPINLTNHVYFNLGGPAATGIGSHELHVEADAFLPVDATLIPTGEIRGVGGTPWDFRGSEALGPRLRALPLGYDGNLVLRSRPAGVPAARVVEPRTGRTLDLFTTEPGVQFYTGYYLDGTVGRGGHVYRPFDGFCLETQHFPDSPHHPHFPSAVLRPGANYRQTTVFRFGTA